MERFSGGWKPGGMAQFHPWAWLRPEEGGRGKINKIKIREGGKREGERGGVEIEESSGEKGKERERMTVRGMKRG